MNGSILKDYVSNYKAVQGVMLRREDVSSWDADKLDAFFDFVLRFYDTDGVIRVKPEILEELEQEMPLETCRHREFMHRIDREYDPEDPERESFRQFYPRLATMMRVVINWVQKSPEMLSQATIDKLAGKRQFERILSGPSVTVGPVGGEIVPAWNMDRLAREESYETMLAENIRKVAALFDGVVRSISQKDLARMDTKDKITALKQLSGIYNESAKAFRPGGNTFQQINVFKGNQEDLEKSLLDFADDK